MAEQHDTILVAVEFEGSSRKAIEAARWLAGPLGAEIVLVHAHHRAGFAHPELPGEMVARIEVLVEEAAIRSLAEVAEELGAVRTLFRHGEPAEVILAVAEEIAPRMIVMGTHGRRGLGRFFLGSVAAEVVRASPVPVVTVRCPAEPRG
jgi:nucleotide-binding universal stress UspA family protein